MEMSLINFSSISWNAAIGTVPGTEEELSICRMRNG